MEEYMDILIQSSIHLTLVLIQIAVWPRAGVSSLCELAQSSVQSCQGQQDAENTMHLLQCL